MNHSRLVARPAIAGTLLAGLLACLVLLMACAPHRATAATSDDLPGVPPPPGGVLDPAGTRDTRSAPTTSIAQRVYLTSASADAIVTFYRQRLPALGWQPDAAAPANALPRFRREIFATGSNGPIGIVATLTIAIGSRGTEREVTAILTTTTASRSPAATPTSTPAGPALPHSGGGPGRFDRPFTGVMGGAGLLAVVGIGWFWYRARRPAA